MTVFVQHLPVIRASSDFRLDEWVNKALENSVSRQWRERRTSIAPPKPSPAKTFRASDLTRAIKAVRKAGQAISGSEISSDGTIRILHGSDPEQESNPFDSWKSRRNAGPA